MIDKNAEIGAIEQIVENLSERSRSEYLNFRWDDDLSSMAVEACQYSDYSYTLHNDEGTPLAFASARPVWPGRWGCWIFFADGVEEIWLSLTKWLQRKFLASMADAGADRIDCISLAGDESVDKWFEKTLKGHKECVKLSYGKDGEDYNVWVWRKELSNFPVWK